MCLFCLQLDMLCCFNVQIGILELVIQIQNTIFLALADRDWETHCRFSKVNHLLGLDFLSTIQWSVLLLLVSGELCRKQWHACITSSKNTTHLASQCTGYVDNVFKPLEAGLGGPFIFICIIMLYTRQSLILTSHRIIWCLLKVIANINIWTKWIIFQF